MDQCTHEIRAEHWKGIIKACAQRPTGQSVKGWLDENGICEQSYYYWQRKFRQQVYGLVKGNAPAIPETSGEPGVSFIEIPYQQPVPPAAQSYGCSCVAVIQTPSFRIEVTNDISDAVLARILSEVSHA